MFNPFKRKLGQLIPSEYPSELWFHTLDMDNQYTPDIRELSNKFAHYVFVCGEEQTGHKNNQLVPPAFPLPSPVCMAFTKPEFSYWRKSLGKESHGVPMEMEKKAGNLHDLQKPLSICGELHLIRPEQFLILDKYKENGVVFERKLVDIHIPHLRTVRNDYATAEICYLNTTIPAFMYVGIQDYWKDRLDAGFQFPQVKTVSQMKLSDYGTHDFVTFPYYHFTLDEYND